MERDIVEKLEFGCPFKTGTIGEKDAEGAEVVMQEGADEIKRLRAEVERLTEAAADEPKTRAYWSGAYYRMEAERDRYKAAIENVAEVLDGTRELNMSNFDIDDVAQLNSSHCEVYQIIHAALEARP